MSGCSLNFLKHSLISERTTMISFSIVFISDSFVIVCSIHNITKKVHFTFNSLAIFRSFLIEFDLS
jgi:hypothetical protein